MPKINTPRSGSRAKACTDVNIPDLTKKVPKRLVANAKMESKIDHFPKTLLLWLAIKE